MTTYKDTGIEAPIVFNKLTQTQLSNATDLDPTQQYLVDPEFTGNKLLKTTEDGDIVETNETINDASLIIQKNPLNTINLFPKLAFLISEIPLVIICKIRVYKIPFSSFIAF